jgi:hypothetical protein
VLAGAVQLNVTGAVLSKLGGPALARRSATGLGRSGGPAGVVADTGPLGAVVPHVVCAATVNRVVVADGRPEIIADEVGSVATGAPLAYTVNDDASTVEAQDSATDDGATAAATTATGAGSTVSHGSVMVVTGELVADSLPAASTAVTVNWWVVSRQSPRTVAAVLVVVATRVPPS